jgi:hypothetical protein
VMGQTGASSVSYTNLNSLGVCWSVCQLFQLLLSTGETSEAHNNVLLLHNILRIKDGKFVICTYI